MLQQFSADRPGVTPKQLLQMMMESQYWSADQMLEFQHLQLSQLLCHARQTTRFYKDRLDPVFDRKGNIDFSRWRDIPILTRKDLQKSREHMLSHSVPANHGLVATNATSGSSGQNVKIDITSLAADVSSSAWQRFHSWHGVNLDSGWTQIRAYHPDGSLIAKNVSPALPGKQAPRVVFIKRGLSTKQKLAYLRSTKTKILVDFSNHAELMAHENLRSDNPIRLSAFIGYGMAITPHQESLFQESFHAKTLSPYSSEESMLMACQCADVRHNFHICSELNFVEILDENDNEVPVGQPGRIITTPLFSSAQPLIRYEQGDIVVRGPPCSCGRKLPVLSEIRGRKDAIFQFPGKKVSMNKFDEELVQIALVADAYQFAQVAPEHIVVRYVSPLAAHEANQTIVREHILEMLNTRVAISFDRVKDIPTNSGGKPQRITREF